MNSLKRELFLFTFLLTLLSGLFFLFIYFTTEKLLYLAVDKHLSEDATKFEKYYLEEKEGLEPHLFVLRNPQGLILETNNLELIPPFNQKEGIVNYTKEGKTYRIITLKTSHNLYLQYGIDISQELELLVLLRYVLVSYWLLQSFVLSVFALIYTRKVSSSFESAVNQALEGGKIELYKEIKPIAQALKQKVEELRELYREQSELLLSLSHSVKTPLTRLMLKLEKLKAFTKPELVEELQEELLHLSKKAELFLSLAKVQAGQRKLELQPCNIKSVLLEVLKLYPQEKLKWELEDTFADCDLQVAQELFEVLIDNAFRHGTGEVYVSLKEGVLYVENPSEKPLQGGKGGVGLYVAKRLCTLMNWKLESKEVKEGELYKVTFLLIFH